MTDKLLKLKFGKNERFFPIKLVSDAKVAQDDINQYVTAMRAVRQATLTKKQAKKMRRMQDDLVHNYKYTTDDIEKTLKEKKKKGIAAGNLGLEQTKAAIAVQAARDAIEEAKLRLKRAEKDGEVHELEVAVEEAENRLKERLEEEERLREYVASRKSKLKVRTKDQKWAKVNQRAINANQQADLGAAKEKEDFKGGSGGTPKFNPYARRKVKPKILWEVGQREEKKAEEESADAKKDAGATGKDAAAANEDASTPTLFQEHQEKAAALSQSHQFAIDEEVLAQTNYTNGISLLGSNKKARKRVRKGLSLAEYQERKSAGTL